MAAVWDSCVRCNCLQHGLTVHTTYEVISPYPQFRADVCLNYVNHIVINTGNFLHVLRVDLENLKLKNQRVVDIEQTLNVDTINNEVQESKAELLLCQTPESISVISDYDFNSDETHSKSNFYSESEKSTNTFCSGQNDNNVVCDINVQLQCDNGFEQQTISVKDKILQDFCEDMSQELNIGSEIITLVKHSSCTSSPRSTPPRLPIATCFVLNPSSDILKTSNSDATVKLTPSSPRLMSPPISNRSFR